MNSYCDLFLHGRVKPELIEDEIRIFRKLRFQTKRIDTVLVKPWWMLQNYDFFQVWVRFDGLFSCCEDVLARYDYNLLSTGFRFQLGSVEVRNINSRSLSLIHI